MMQYAELRGREYGYQIPQKSGSRLLGNFRVCIEKNACYAKTPAETDTTLAGLLKLFLYYVHLCTIMVTL